MANQALAILESALRVRKLDRTLTTALAPLEHGDLAALLPTDVSPLDACLRGGFPRGQLSEITGLRSSGRTTLLLQTIAAATRRGEIAALVDTFDRLDVASASAAGIDLSRLLWIRGQAVSRTEGATDLRERTIDRALKALGLVLQAGGFGVVVLDVADVPPAALRQLPYTTWLRVQRMIEGSDTACLVAAPEPLARSAGGLTLTLSASTGWSGDSDRSRRLSSINMTAKIVSPRRRFDGEVEINAHVAAAEAAALQATPVARGL